MPPGVPKGEKVQYHRQPSKYSGKVVLAREREMLAVQCRKAGMTFAAIGRKLGITEMGASAAVRRTVARIVKIANEDAVQVRNLELLRLDRLQLAHWKFAMKGDPKSSLILLQVQERRSKLLGLDAPKKLDLGGEVGMRVYEGVPVSEV